MNLASRLCAEAAHGEVLVDARTRELIADEQHRARLLSADALSLKGFAEPVPSFTLAAG